MRYQNVPLTIVTLLSVVSAAPSPNGWWQHLQGHNKQGGGGNGYVAPPSNSYSASSAESSSTFSGSSNSDSDFSGTSTTGNSLSGGSTTGTDTNEGTANGDTTANNGTSGGLSTGDAMSGALNGTLNGTSTSGDSAGASLSTKKGTGTWLATLLDVSWAYDWTDNPTASYKGTSSIDLVPLIDTKSDLNTLATSSYKEILGYNEPEIAGLSGNGTVDVNTAISQWPDVVATGKRIGSPAPGVAKVYEGDWLDLFMQGIAKAGSHVDFIALHYYTTDGDVSDFQSYIEATYTRYNKPIWITEFGYVDYGTTPPTQPDYPIQIQYMQAAVKMLNGLSYVERFLWCDVPNSGKGEYVNGEPTELGTAYKAL